MMTTIVWISPSPANHWLNGAVSPGSARDLADPRWIYFKAALLCAILIISALLIFIEVPTWRVVLLLGLVIWASARIYYFVFYVLERYVDPSYRFSGVSSALSFILKQRRGDD